MTTFIYHCPEAPESRRYIAQSEKLADRLYVTFQGPTAEAAKAKMDLHNEFAALDSKERKGFGYAARLRALGGEDEQPEVTMKLVDLFDDL